MTKITSKLEFFIYRAIDDLKGESDEVYMEVIRTSVKYLKGFEEDKWREFNEKVRVLPLLKKIEDYAGDSLSVLVAFCLLSESVSKGIIYPKEYYEIVSLAITSCISNCFVESETDLQIDDFSLFAKAFVNSKVYSLLLDFDKEKFATIYPDFIKLIYEILENCPLEELSLGDYSSIERTIRHFKEEKDNSFFHGNYKLENIYDILEEYLREQGLLNCHTDRRVLALGYLKDISTMSEEIKKALVLDIAELELDNDDVRNAFFDNVLNYIFYYYVNEVHQLDVISSKSSLFLAVKDFVSDLSNAGQRDEFTRMLTIEVLKALKTYDECAFHQNAVDKELYEYMEIYVSVLGDKRIFLTMFLLFSYRIDVLYPDDINMMSFIAYYLDEYRVPTIYYKEYLNIFLTEPIYETLKHLDQDMMFYCVKSIIRDMTIDDIKNGNLDLVYFYLSQFSKTPYSPLFKNDYSLLNVYNTLLNIMCDPRYELFFKESDRQKLEVVWDMVVSLSEEEIEFLKQSLHKIEEKYNGSTVRLVKKITDYIHGYWIFREKGIGVLKNEKKI